VGIVLDFTPLHDIVDDISLYDPNYPQDTFAVLPVVGVPFAYNQFRQGRGNLPSTLASLMLGVGMSEFAMYYGLRQAGYSSLEIALARTGSALGFRYGGRGLTGLMIWGPRTMSAGISWAVPLWIYPLAAYEIWQAGDWWMEEGRFRAYDSLAYEYSQ
jgi:hypothetical protein